jgi:putative oxidoreductase
VRELTATGVGEPLARSMIGLGRLVQLIATPCLFFHTTRTVAAILLAVFLIGATYTAHAFWKAAPADRDRQLANCLKNVAIVGGLLLTAGWST